MRTGLSGLVALLTSRSLFLPAVKGSKSCREAIDNRFEFVDAFMDRALGLASSG